MLHTNETFNAVDVDLCNAQWNNFVELHHLEIARLKESPSKTLRWFVA
ncbi:hypothetical protein NC797_02895 [Aquibacillus sp. 3ASR75-11]|uniref:Uncharacterized protein n=1 Tax=Terrihalobacillus insolitus TaxID=2950438 RepID=A0A9X3WRP1_9BACI|nr:hypothetical protein [Terrihalobacillus insolitus]MDC3411868.1 hypothetical protein [Terrihalobacillus insolitus]MDC3423453.1 hypothetical protein [Terrihalobacillus insolitus]